MTERPRGRWGAGLVLVVVFAAPACGDEPGGGVSSSSTATSSSAGGNGGGSAGVGSGGAGQGGSGGQGGMLCAAHENAATPVAMEMVAEALPAPSGGPISRGTYELIAVKRYTGPGGMEGATSSMFTETQVWSAVDMQSVLEFPDGEGERKLQFAYDLQDGSGGITLQILCPGSLSIPWDSYTATMEALTLYATNTKIAFEYSLTVPDD